MKISATKEVWALKESFTISRGTKSHIESVVVTVDDGHTTGVGESIPYPRYDQNADQTVAAVLDIGQRYPNGVTRQTINDELPADSARNALDCALWDFEAKKSNTPAWKLAGLSGLHPAPGVYTLSLESPEQLYSSARATQCFPILKIKLGKAQPIESVAAVRNARPDARIIVDANEAWDLEMLEDITPELKHLHVEMIEQPLPAKDDEALESTCSEIPLCADESFHSTSDLKRLLNRYQMFNIKLDKTGGLTEALAAAEAIKKASKHIMVGSMMATSLGLAPAMLLTSGATYVDLDSPAWLDKDRPGGMKFEDGMVYPATRSLWG